MKRIFNVGDIVKVAPTEAIDSLSGMILDMRVACNNYYKIKYLVRLGSNCEVYMLETLDRDTFIKYCNYDGIIVYNYDKYLAEFSCIRDCIWSKNALIDAEPSLSLDDYEERLLRNNIETVIKV